MDSSTSHMVVADLPPAPFSQKEITDLDAHELTQFGLLTNDVIVLRLRGRDHTAPLRGTRVTSRKSLIETMKMRNLKTKLPTYRISFWEFAFSKTFVMFAQNVDALNNHIVSQEMMEVCWIQMLNLLYKKWAVSGVLSLRMKEEKLAAARLQANPLTNKKTRRYWDKKAKKVWESHGVRLKINDGYNIEGISNLSQVNRKGKSYETVNEDTLFGFQDIVPSHGMRTSREELREQRELLGNPEVDMKRIARIAEQELAKATQQLASFGVSELDDDDPNTSDDDGSIAEEVFKHKEVKTTDIGEEEDFEGDNEESSEDGADDFFEEEHAREEDFGRTNVGDVEMQSLAEYDEEFRGFGEKEASLSDESDGTDTSDDSDEGLMVITSTLPPGIEPEYDTWKGSEEDGADGEFSDEDSEDKNSPLQTKKTTPITQTPQRPTPNHLTFNNHIAQPIPNKLIPTSSVTRLIPRTIVPKSTLNSAHQIHRTIRVPASSKHRTNQLYDVFDQEKATTRGGF